MSSSGHSIQPSNWRTQRYNRMGARWYQLARIPDPPDQGIPCHARDSTKPSYLPTNLPANWRNHRRSCKDQRVVVG